MEKGRRYGTILVDLERHKIIDLLQDRERSTFAAWLRAHPTVRVISRDRATDYAAAAREAAPQALQVADRYHLVRNLADALELLLARCRTEIRRGSQERLPEDELLPEASPVSLPPSAQVWRQQPTQRAERAYHAHRAEREDRYRQLSALHAQGMMQTEIARRVGISTYQVRTWRHRRQERLSIDVKAPIKVSSIPTLLTCSIEGLPESMMASNSMKRSERSGFLEVFAWCATSCSINDGVNLDQK